MLINETPAQAVTRPFAGLGAGAFASHGAGFGSGRLAAIGSGHTQRTYEQGRYAGVGCANLLAATSIDARTSTTNSTTKQFDQMTRVVPVIPGGVGSHTEREHKPV